MRRAVTPAIAPSLYRHFAVVTVLLTAILAMFAEGESLEAQAAAVAQPASAKPAAQAVLATANGATRQAPGWWYVDSYSDSDTSGTLSGLIGGDSGVIPDFGDTEVPGYSPEYLASLTEEERELLLAGLEKNGMLEPEIRDRSSAALAAASSRRSGAASGGD